MPVKVKLSPICGYNGIVVYSIGDVSDGVAFSNDLISRFDGFGRHFPPKKHPLMYFGYDQIFEKIKNTKFVFPDFSDIFKEFYFPDPFHVFVKR